MTVTILNEDKPWYHNNENNELDASTFHLSDIRMCV